jgi:hypothetical protein
VALGRDEFRFALALNKSPFVPAEALRHAHILRRNDGRLRSPPPAKRWGGGRGGGPLEASSDQSRHRSTQRRHEWLLGMSLRAQMIVKRPPPFPSPPLARARGGRERRRPSCCPQRLRRLLRCVHALARKREPRGRELCQRAGSPPPRGRTESKGVQVQLISLRSYGEQRRVHSIPKFVVRRAASNMRALSRATHAHNALQI